MTGGDRAYDAQLERMANQIARQFAAHGPESAAVKLADHLQRFWDPSMREALVEAVTAGRVQTDAIVVDAVRLGLISTT